MTNTRKERALGLLEKYQLSKRLLRAYGNVCYTAELEHPHRSEDAAQFYLTRLKFALQTLITKHASLSLIIRDKDKSTVHFEQLECIDLAKVVTVSSEKTTLDSLIQEQCTIEFDLDSQAPLWRLKIVPTSPTRCFASLTVHHTMGDGMSLYIFWKELLEGLKTNAEDKEQGSLIYIPDNLKVYLPFESCSPPAISIFSDVLPAVAKSYATKLLPGLIANALSDNDWRGDFPAVDGEPHSTEVMTNKIEKNQWEAILKEAKRHQVSGHAILYALFVLAWATLYNDFSVSVETPVNCRRLCNPPVPQNQMGNFVGAHKCHWKKEYLSQILEKREIWVMAKEYHDKLQNGKEKAARQSLLLKYLATFPASYSEYWQDKRQNPMKREGGLELSDVGKLDCYGDEWKLVSLYFCQSANTFSTAFGMNSVCLNNELHYTVGWQKGSVDQDKILEFNRVFNELIQSLQ
ncbi:hypothetical protein G6F57_009626 [Rhizopus arrhizus]|nr:hypothetical protein G6F30_010180 [Rhizopus arrhizus]KAG1414401.1 hypothetical protein G6F58_006977 [Rhizopus delemar]KAG0986006.1 hypothetical protein G6F29_003593 [Rhizopus arrhizus]KAG0987440.1 hypothetical protein G6F28_010012 [Rhizopus arrhizus]KAG1004082.1 hypothetical protein G6F27_010467 [Rhizopus arrhizus]